MRARVALRGSGHAQPDQHRVFQGQGAEGAARCQLGALAGQYAAEDHGVVGRTRRWCAGRTAAGVSAGGWVEREFFRWFRQDGSTASACHDTNFADFASFAGTLSPLITAPDVTSESDASEGVTYVADKAMTRAL